MKKTITSVVIGVTLFILSSSPTLAAYCTDMGIFGDTIINSNINLASLGYPQSIQLGITDTSGNLRPAKEYEVRVHGGQAWQWMPGNSLEGSFAVTNANSYGSTTSFNFDISNSNGALGSNHETHHLYLFDKTTNKEICYIGEYFTKPQQNLQISSPIEIYSGCGVVHGFGTSSAFCKINGQNRSSGYAVCTPPPAGTVSSNNITCCANQSRCDNLASAFKEEAVLACGNLIPSGKPSICPNHCGPTQWNGSSGCCGTFTGAVCTYVSDPNQSSIEIPCGEFLPANRNAHCAASCPQVQNTQVNKWCCGFSTDKRCLPKKPTTAAEYEPLVRNCGVITKSSGILELHTCQIESQSLERGNYTQCSNTLRCCFTRDQCTFFDPLDNRCNAVTVNTSRGCSGAEICTAVGSNFICKSDQQVGAPGSDPGASGPSSGAPSSNPSDPSEDGTGGGNTQVTEPGSPIDAVKGPTNATFNALNPLNIAAGRPGQSARSPFFTVLQTPGGVISRALAFAFPIAGMVLFLMIVWGGFEMVTGATNAKSMDAGKQRITAAVIGFILLFTSYWLMQIIGTIFGLAIL
jgi:hypothetical protein